MRRELRFAIAAVLLAVYWFIESIPIVHAADGNADEVLRKILREGDQFLIKGRSHYQDALGKYTQAIAMKPNDPKVVFRRAELHFMMKDWTASLQDLQVVIAADPHHRKGLETRAKIRASMGQLVDAAEDFDGVSLAYSHANNAKKAEKFRVEAEKARDLGVQWEDIKQALKNRKVGRPQWVHTNEHCITLLSEIIARFAKDNSELRLHKVECALAIRDHQAMTQELKHVQQREPHNLRAIALSAQAFRILGAISNAKADIRRCLSLDPEFPRCAKLHKLIKVYEKASGEAQQGIEHSNWQKALNAIDQCFKLEEDPPNLDQLYRWQCRAYRELNKIDEGIEACTKSIDLEGNKNPTLLDVFFHLADLHIMQDDLGQAEADINLAAESNPNNQRINEFRQKLENLKKRAAMKDYYKILGIKKSATDKEISKAFRKLSRENHPDVLRGQELTDMQREKKERLYRDILEAKEVLSDDEKRRRYDNGEDVANPQNQQQQQRQHHGFDPFGGGGGNFHFQWG